jgi:hypothetical protein
MYITPSNPNIHSTYRNPLRPLIRALAIYRPTETWPNQEHQEIDVAVNAAIDQMNQEDPKKLIEKLKSQVETSEDGIKFALLKGFTPEEAGEYSDEEAVVMFNPFAGGATPNMLVRTELIRRVAKLMDVRDSKGKLKPVIMLSSPAYGGSRLKLSEAEKQAVKSGDFGSIAETYLKVVSAKNIGKAALLGFSQGADLALSAASIASKANIDISRLAIGDPARVMNRGSLTLMGDFSKATNLGDMKKATGLDAQAEALDTMDFIKFLSSSVGIGENRAIMDGLGKDKFGSLANQLLGSKEFEKLIVGYGEKSAIAQPSAIVPSLALLHEDYGHDRLVSIKIAEGQHTWGDQLRLLMKLYALVH